jgi:hypothetical protein
MTFIEFLGFVISLFAMLFLFARQIFENRRRRNLPEEEEREQYEEKENLKDFLKALNIDIPDEEKIPPFHPREENPIRQQKSAEFSNKSQPKLHGVPTQRIVKDEFGFESTLDAYRPKTAIESRNLKTNIEQRYAKPFLGTKVVSPDLLKLSNHDPYAIAKERNPRVLYLFKNLKSRKDMIIYQEVMNPPKSLRK